MLTLNEVIKSKKVVFTFGRMNPPTVGHAKLIEKALSVAQKEGADLKIYVSQSQDSKRNPLSHSQKIKYLKLGFPSAKGGFVTSKNAKTPFEAMGELIDQGYTDVVLVVGQDRVSKFRKEIGTYVNHKDPKKSFKLNSFKVVSAGTRDPDADSVEGMSASKMREAAINNDFKSFSSGLMNGLSKQDKKSLFSLVRKGLGVRESAEEDTAINKNMKTFRLFVEQERESQVLRQKQKKEKQELDKRHVLDMQKAKERDLERKTKDKINKISS